MCFNMRNLGELLYYYHNTRGAGHTALLKDGTNNYKGKFILIASNKNHARDIARENIYATPMSLDAVLQDRRLKGVRLPIALDNSAVTHILDGVIELENECAEAERVAKAWRDECAEMYQKLQAHKKNVEDYIIVKDTWVYKVSLRVSKFFKSFENPFRPE